MIFDDWRQIILVVSSQCKKYSIFLCMFWTITKYYQPIGNAKVGLFTLPPTGLLSSYSFHTFAIFKNVIFFNCLYCCCFKFDTIWGRILFLYCMSKIPLLHKLMGWNRNCLAESFYFEQKTILTQLVTDLVAATETRLLEYKHLFNVKHAPNDQGSTSNTLCWCLLHWV